MYSFVLLAFFWALWPSRTHCQLIVNVGRNKTHPDIGVVRQTIVGNSSTDTVNIEFKEVHIGGVRLFVRWNVCQLSVFLPVNQSVLLLV